MADRPARKPRKPHTAQVVRTERLTPHMQRVVLGGEDSPRSRRTPAPTTM